MILITKSDSKRHYVSCMFDFAELLYGYLGQDAVDAFRDFLKETHSTGVEERDAENLDELHRYVLQVLLPGIANEVKRFRNHPDMDERLNNWAERYKGKVDDIYGNTF